MNFSQMILKLQNFWCEQGCAIIQPYDYPAGAGTFHPQTFLHSLSSRDHAVCYVAPSRRPADGRYGDNPNRLGAYYQFQVLIKPSPKDIQELYLKSLEAIGIDIKKHDIRFVEDNWESPSLGAWGLGWEVWLDGMEVTQFTYFQQVAGFSPKKISAEITYGLERIAMYLQNKNNVYDIVYSEFNGKQITYGDIHLQNEKQYSKYNFECANSQTLMQMFENSMSECKATLENGLALPAYDYCLLCSHIFNVLDARGISKALRQEYMLKVRELSKRCAEVFLENEK